MNSCEQLGSPVPQPCLPQLLFVPGLGLWAFGASSGPRDAATLSGSGEALLAGGDFHPNDNNNQPHPHCPRIRPLPFLRSESQPAASENALPQSRPSWKPSFPHPGARRRCPRLRHRARLESKAGAGAGEEGGVEEGARVGRLQQAVQAPWVGNTFASHVGTFFFSHPI